MSSLVAQILAWIAERSSDEALREQLARAVVKRADYVRTGYLVYLSVPDGSAAVSDTALVPSVDICSPLLRDGGGATLFLREGYLHYLEIYARGGFFPEHLEDFALDAEV